MTAYIPKKEIAKLLKRLTPTDKTLWATGKFMREQVEDRFRSQGASGGQAWPQKRMRSWGYDDGRAILTGPSGELRRSFNYRVADGAAICGSFVPYSYVQQVGTVGKGGTLPTRFARKARALFVPITDKAVNSNRFVGQEAADLRSHFTGRTVLSQGPFRVGVKSRKNMIQFFPLKKGRIHDGKLQVWDEKLGEYRNGVPDFVFLSKVDIAPRPMLGTSPQEIDAVVKFFASTLISGNK